MSIDDLEVIELEENKSSIEYKAFTKRYGRAYFTFCLERDEEGNIQKVWIGTMQQPDKKGKIFLYNAGGHTSIIRFQSWTHKGVGEPIARTVLWCKHHECEQVRVLVPQETKILTIVEYSSEINIYFQKENVFS